MQDLHFFEHISLKLLSVEEHVEELDYIKILLRHFSEGGEHERLKLELCIYLLQLVGCEQVSIVIGVMAIDPGEIFWFFIGTFLVAECFLGVFFILLIILALDVLKKVPV